MSGENDSPYILTDALLERFKYFLQDSDLDRMNRTLRKLFFDYLRQQHAGLDVNFDTILDDVEALMDLLDFASDQTNDLKNKLPHAFRS